MMSMILCWSSAPRQCLPGGCWFPSYNYGSSRYRSDDASFMPRLFQIVCVRGQKTTLEREASDDRKNFSVGSTRPQISRLRALGAARRFDRGLGTGRDRALHVHRVAAAVPGGQTTTPRGHIPNLPMASSHKMVGMSPATRLRFADLSARASTAHGGRCTWRAVHDPLLVLCAAAMSPRWLLVPFI